MKKTLIFVVYMLACSLAANSQKFLLTGCVTDSISGEPLPYSVIQMTDHAYKNVFNGVVTNEDGVFSFDNIELADGEYLFTISHIGYKKKQIPLDVGKKERKIELGKITLEMEAQSIHDVVVTASINRQYVDKKKYAITESLLTNVSVSLDLLRKIPELMVDEILRTVTIKGKENVLVLLNGVDTGTSVDIRSINYRDIESIEVITTTSSGTDIQYDGIINIILKTKVRQGLSIDSELTAMSNRNSTDAYAGLVFGREKIRANLAYTNRYRALPYRVSQIRENEDAGTSYTEEGYCEDPFELSHNLKFDVDYYISQKDFFNISTLTKSFKRDRSISSENRMIVDDMVTELPGFISRNKANITNGNYMFFYRRQLSAPDNNLSVSANFNFDKTTYETEIIYADDRTLFNNEPSDKHAVNIKIEYNNKINEIFRFNTGGQWYFQDYKGSLNNEKDAGNLKNQRYNGYIDWFVTYKSYQIVFGLKGEINKNKFKRPEYGSNSQVIIQPQVTAMKKIDKINSVTLSYLRRPYYPSPWLLAPYEILLNDKTISKGNPGLEPEVYNYLELYHTFNTDKNVFLRTNLYWTHCNNKISSLPFFDEELTSVTMPANGADYNRAGLKINASLWIKGFIQFDPSLNFFYEKMKTRKSVSDAFSQMLGGSLMVWLPAGFGVGAYGSYNGKRAIDGGYRKHKYSVDALFLMKRFDKINLNLFAGYQYVTNSPEITETYSDHVKQRNYYKSDANGFIVRASFFFNVGEKSKMERVKNNFDTNTRE